MKKAKTMTITIPDVPKHKYKGKTGKGTGGRMTKYLPIFNDWLIEHFSSGGEFQTFIGYIYFKSKSLITSKKQEDIELRNKLELESPILIARQTLYDWLDPKNNAYQKDFHDTKKGYEMLANYWWQELAVRDEKINPSKWIFLMKNRFAWKDRVESIPGEESIQKKDNAVSLLKEALADVKRFNKRLDKSEGTNSRNAKKNSGNPSNRG